MSEHGKLTASTRENQPISTHNACDKDIKVPFRKIQLNSAKNPFRTRRFALCATKCGQVGLCDAALADPYKSSRNGVTEAKAPPSQAIEYLPSVNTMPRLREYSAPAICARHKNTFDQNVVKDRLAQQSQQRENERPSPSTSTTKDFYRTRHQRKAEYPERLQHPADTAYLSPKAATEPPPPTAQQSRSFKAFVHNKPLHSPTSNSPRLTRKSN